MESRDLDTPSLIRRLYRRARTFALDREGATAIEYAVIAGLISIAVILAATPIGTRVGALMDIIRNAIGAA
ncbi:Flp family type IVb pilin [Pseudomonas nitroreducens]|uniref:Flp family type IVb pilin n=1 Tax=Pseudomonas nitroreducens TaxID=46680 RepID=UPI00381DB1B6